MPLFDGLQPEPLDPIMASFQAFAGDPRPDRVNLGVGMYYDADGRIPVLGCVQKAERILAQRDAPWSYLLPDGLPALQQAAKRLVFGDALVAEMGDRIVTVQTLGGTGALRLGADIIRKLAPGTQVALSRPTWGNHPSLFQGAGLTVTEYPYYDPATGGLDFPAMRDTLGSMAPGSVVLLHACCHNPTGADLSPEQWHQVAALVRQRGLIPFLDMAYAGFGDGLEADCAHARMLAQAGTPLFVATSFSKSFGLYGERIGALSIIAADARQAALVLEQAKVAVRTSYSTPPSHGALLVATVLGDPILRAEWQAELEGMRRRIIGMREALVARMGGDNRHDFARLVRQKGLFSYSGLSPAQMARLQDEFGIYAVSDGRLCMAALTPGNLDRVASSLRAVVG